MTEPTTLLDESDAVAAVAAAVRRLFGRISERQARDLAAAVLRDLRREHVWLVRIPNDLSDREAEPRTGLPS